MLNIFIVRYSANTVGRNKPYKGGYKQNRNIVNTLKLSPNNKSEHKNVLKIKN